MLGLCDWIRRSIFLCGSFYVKNGIRCDWIMKDGFSGYVRCWRSWSLARGLSRRCVEDTPASLVF